MKPDPEELENETTPDIEAEITAAGDEFFASVEYAEPVDWRKFPDEEEDD